MNQLAKWGGPQPILLWLAGCSSLKRGVQFRTGKRGVEAGRYLVTLRGCLATLDVVVLFHCPVQKIKNQRRIGRDRRRVDSMRPPYFGVYCVEPCLAGLARQRLNPTRYGRRSIKVPNIKQQSGPFRLHSTLALLLSLNCG